MDCVNYGAVVGIGVAVGTVTLNVIFFIYVPFHKICSVVVFTLEYVGATITFTHFSDPPGIITGVLDSLIQGPPATMLKALVVFAGTRAKLEIYNEVLPVL